MLSLREVTGSVTARVPFHVPEYAPDCLQF